MKKIALLCAAAGLSAPALATNGMNLSGYGPVSVAMGGTAMAYDNGTAAVINNPATLGFMASGTSRLDLALGDLMPKVSSLGQDSSAKDFYTPAIGYARKDGKLSWGFGIMAQGGMGTEYSSSAQFGPAFGLNVLTRAGYPVADPGLKNKSEIGIGRAMFPLVYNVTPDLNIGGTIDFLWGGMDVKWMVDGAHFGTLMAGAPFGALSGTALNAFQGALMAGAFTSVDYGYFDFDTGSKFTQKATTTGWAGNIGFTYRLSPQLSIGGVYHMKTRLSDMETGSEEASASFAVRGGLLGTTVVPLKGKVIVKNFEWPETYGFGISYQPNSQWMVNVDYKRINWADTMKNFSLSFVASDAATNGGFASTALDLTYFQNWENQNVFQIGFAYKYSDALTLRAGGNFANNPIPDQYVTPLFPAIAKNHYSVGVGYAFSKVSSVDAAWVHEPKVNVTNNWSAGGGVNQNISMGGNSWQVMYSHRF